MRHPIAGDAGAGDLAVEIGIRRIVGDDPVEGRILDALHVDDVVVCSAGDEHQGRLLPGRIVTRHLTAGRREDFVLHACQRRCWIDWTAAEAAAAGAVATRSGWRRVAAPDRERCDHDEQCEAHPHDNISDCGLAAWKKARRSTSSRAARPPGSGRWRKRWARTPPAADAQQGAADRLAGGVDRRPFRFPLVFWGAGGRSAGKPRTPSAMFLTLA